MMVRHAAGHLHDLAAEVLRAAGCARENADAVAEALLRAEALGLAEHGLRRLPAWADAVAGGAVDGWAQPEAAMPSQTAVRIDARGGFAAPAVAYAVAAAEEQAQQMGMAAAAVVNGHHPEPAVVSAGRLAERGLVGLAFGVGMAVARPGGRPRPLQAEDAALTTLRRLAGREDGLVLVAFEPAAFGSAFPAEAGDRGREDDAVALPQELYDALLLKTRRRS